jgi:hypothetical protein
MLDGVMLGGITMNTLKHMLQNGKNGREMAWTYFRQMQKIDAANVRHYTKMLQTCRKESEIDGLMAELDQSGIRPNAGNALDCCEGFSRLVLPVNSTGWCARCVMASDFYYAPQGVRAPRPVHRGWKGLEDGTAQRPAGHFRYRQKPTVRDSYPR